MVQPYSIMDRATAWKKSRFILSDRLDFHMIDNLFHTFARLKLSLSVDEMLQPRCVKWSTNFRDSSFLFKTHVFCFTYIHVEVSYEPEA